jgi:abequosyltransferase
MMETATPRLSICMPTYNYGRFISTAIRSVLDQNAQNVEIVVLDGGSTDDTRQIVEKLVARFPAVRYHRQPERGGIDRDLERVVEHASGDYCWLLSADDALAAGALAHIDREIAGGHEILLCNRFWCDADLRPLRRETWLRNGGDDRTVNLARRKEVLRFLGDARSLGALFSFMSCIVFRRRTWLGARTEMSLHGTNYAHVQRLFAMAGSGPGLKYIAEPLVLCRGGNDSFREGGLAGRLLIDLRGFSTLAESIFPDDQALQQSFRRVVMREHHLPRWIRARSETRDVELWREVERALASYGMRPAQLMLVRALGAMLGAVRRRFLMPDHTE